MELLSSILEKSAAVDDKFVSLDPAQLADFDIVLEVPSFHPRHDILRKYHYKSIPIDEVPQLSPYTDSKHKIVLVDKNLSDQPFLQKFFSANHLTPFLLESKESSIKVKDNVDKFIEDHHLRQFPKCLVMTIGGGLLLNVGAYIAEQLSADLILVPTTVLSMADGTGGKVRINNVAFGRAHKHYYKSFYEPNLVVFDERFLVGLPDLQVSIGLCEIIKHSLFQSPKLYYYLHENANDLFEDKQKLKKAILWTADLKRVCLDIDVEENENGSRKILRGGHGFSDRIEEDLKFQVPHGFAVAVGIMQELEYEHNDELLKKAATLFDLFDIPKTIDELKSKMQL
jgi:3-dehydroquinate synthetase